MEEDIRYKRKKKSSQKGRLIPKSKNFKKFYKSTPPPLGESVSGPQAMNGYTLIPSPSPLSGNKKKRFLIFIFQNFKNQKKSKILQVP